MDPSATRCGVDKCFFPSLTNAALGYLVAGSSRYEEMHSAFTLAQRLERNFGMHHFNIEPPYRVVTTPEWTAKLNSVVVQPGRKAQGLKPQDVYGTEDDKDDLDHLIVQVVQRAPEPHLFIGIGENNQDRTLQGIREFVKHIPNRYAFDARFEKELHRIRAILQDHPVLHVDFQALVDVHGRVYVIDLDLDENWKDELPEDIDSALQEDFEFLDQVRQKIWEFALSRAVVS